MTPIIDLQPGTASRFVQGYIGAVTSAVSIAVSVDTERCFYFLWGFFVFLGGGGVRLAAPLDPFQFFTSSSSLVTREEEEAFTHLPEANQSQLLTRLGHRTKHTHRDRVSCALISVALLWGPLLAWRGDVDDGAELLNWWYIQILQNIICLYRYILHCFTTEDIFVTLSVDVCVFLAVGGLKRADWSSRALQSCNQVASEEVRPLPCCGWVPSDTCHILNINVALWLCFLTIIMKSST